MKRFITAIALALLTCSPALAQQTPDFNGPAVTYDYGTCTNAAGVSCTFTTLNTYGVNAVAICGDQATTNPVNVVCTVSGNTVTVTNAQTLVVSTCAMSVGTTCTWVGAGVNPPYAISSFARCVAGGTTGTIVGHCLLSTQTVTVTAASSNSDTWQIMLYESVPSATGHTFNVLVLQ